MAESAGQQFAKLPVSTKLIVGALLLTLVAAGFYSTLYSSIDQEIQGRRATQVSLQDELREAKNVQQQFVRLREELEARKPIDRENLRVLPERAEIATVLQDLNRLAELSGLDIQAVRPRPEETEKFFVRIPVSLQVSGRYHQLAKFFHNVSRLQRAINIENISISAPARKTTEETEGVVLTVEVLATTFRRKTENPS